MPRSLLGDVFQKASVLSLSPKRRLAYFRGLRGFGRICRGESIRDSSPNRRSRQLGSEVIFNKYQWAQDKHRLVKTIPIGDAPLETIKLVVIPHKKVGPPFRIRVLPCEIITDEIALFQMANEYPTAAEAQKACEEIAQRALVHISPQHFGIFEQDNQEIPSAGDVGGETSA